MGRKWKGGEPEGREECFPPQPASWGVEGEVSGTPCQAVCKCPDGRGGEPTEFSAGEIANPMSSHSAVPMQSWGRGWRVGKRYCSWEESQQHRQLQQTQAHYQGEQKSQPQMTVLGRRLCPRKQCRRTCHPYSLALITGPSWDKANETLLLGPPV